MRAIRQSLTTCSAIALAAGLAASSGAQAALTVSNGATKDVTCSGGVCTATSKKAVLNAADLTNMLGSGDVKLVSGSQAQDIKIAAPLSWANTSRLTLDAYRGIEVDQPVTVTGTGALTVTTNDGGKGGTFLTSGKGYVIFWDTNSNVIINGNTYALKATIGDLASAIAGNNTGNFALATSYDAKHDGTYSAAPIAYFGGRFEGFGNTIDHLKIKGPSNTQIGLFANTNGAIENMGLPNASVSGGKAADVGALAGVVYGGGTVSNVWSSGSVSGGDSTSSTLTVAGGLLGGLYDGSSLVNSHSSANVIGGGSAWAGGLIGNVGSSSPNNTAIIDSFAAGAVTAGDNILGQYQGSQAGGLVGNASSSSGPITIGRDYATGAVTVGSGNGYSGGLVANTYGPVSVILSHASGAVTVGAGSSTNGIGIAGALIGQLYPSGTAAPAVDQSYATGTVSGGDLCDFGALFGYSQGQVTNSYATGVASTSGSNTIFMGGYGGWDNGVTSSSYSIGAVQGNGGTTAGGFLGGDGGTQAENYWDTNTSGFTQGCGYPQNCSGVTGLTTAQLQAQLPDGFSKKVWALNPKKNGGFPYLIANPPSK